MSGPMAPEAAFSVGTASLARLAERLALPSAVRLASCDVQHDRLRLVLGIPRLPPLVLSLEPARPGSAAFLSRGGAQVSYRLGTATAGLPASLEALVRGLCLKVLSVPWRELASLAEPEPAPAPSSAPEAPPAPPEGHDAPNPPRPLLDTSWGCFLADDRHSRDLYASLRFDVSVTHVVHADAECMNESPMARLIRQPLVVNPWETVAAVSAGVHPASSPRVERLSTDLGDLDIIRGTLPRLEALLEQVGESATTDVVVVSNSCVPNILSEDLGATVRRFRRACPRPVFYSDQKDPSLDRHLASLVRQLALQAGDAPEPAPGSAALLGLHDPRGRDELSALLAAAGVPVVGALIPDVSIERLRGARRAEVVVHPARSTWNPVCEELVGHLPGRPLKLPAPFGVAGSRAWLQAVAAEVDRVDALDAAWTTTWEPLRGEWERLHARASGLGLGFLLQPAAARRLLADGGLWGVPALEIALEAGFVVTLGLIGEPEVSGEWEPLVTPWRARALRVVPVPTEQALHALLRDGTIDAALSEFFDDGRLTSAGAGRFSLADLECGPGGALRTALRLVERATVPLLRAQRANGGKGEPR